MLTRRLHPAHTAVAILVALVAIVAPAAAQDLIATGRYIGDGAASRTVGGVGFAPDLVIVKSALDTPAYARTTTMAVGRSVALDATGTATNRIVSLGPDGFGVGSDAAVNAVGISYTWVAMKASSSLLALGSYVGNGAAYRLVNGPAFAAAAVLVLGEDARAPVLRIETMGAGLSLPTGGGSALDDGILDTVDGGFHVGAADAVNRSGGVYHYVAWNAATDITAIGSYNGNGNEGRAVDGVGFQPQWVVVAGVDQATLVHRAAALGAGDVTQFFGRTPDSGGLITATTLDGFTVGAADAINAPSSKYAWLAFQVPAEAADLAVTASATPAAPAVGDTVRIRYTLSNLSALPTSGAGATTTIDPGLVVTGHVAGAGTWDEVSGVWTVGDLGPGALDTLLVTTVVAAGQEGAELVAGLAVSASDKPDPEPRNDTAEASVVVALPTASGFRLRAVPGEPVTARPGDAARPLLTFALANVGTTVDTLRSLRIVNFTPGGGTPAEMDAEWDKLEITLGTPKSEETRVVALASFIAGEAVFGNLATPVAAGDTLMVTVVGSPSLAARDGVPMQLGVRTPADIGVTSNLYDDGTWPLATGQRLIVDGFVAAQAAVHQVPYRLLSVGSTDNLAFDVTLPSNGYLADAIYGFNLINLGSAAPSTDIARLKAWSDDGDGVFSPTADTFLGLLVNSGDRWQLTGLNAPVPAGGVRVFFTVDVAETAQPAREVRLGLPVDHGPGVEMVSGNDGPVDRSLESAVSLGVSVSDRVIITAGSIAPAVVRPGARGVPLLDLVMTNTYTQGFTLQGLAVTNACTGALGATAAQMDSTLRQVTLRLDGDGDGALDDLVTDPVLGTGAFRDSRLVFQGLALDLPGGASRRVFVAGDVSLTGAADGDRLSAVVGQGGDIVMSGASVVAGWPLDSGAEWRVDGMVRDQLTVHPVAVQSLGPLATRNLALDVDIPANGYQDDSLVGMTVANTGSAGPGDLSAVELWHDGGNGFFDAGSLDDTLLGEMTWTAGVWSSAVLNHPVPRPGLRMYVSVDVAETPADSSTVRLAVPTGGVVMASGDTGPLDRECLSVGSLVLSTSPLHSTLVFTTAASTVGQAGTIRMTVQNTGTETVAGVTPRLDPPAGDAVVTIGSPTPAVQDIGVGQEVQFVWPFTAVDAGTATVVGSASGQGGGGETFASVPMKTPEHTVYTPVTGLELYPVTNLPTSVNRGQTGLVPLTLTLVNPGTANVADGLVTRLRLRLAETAEGAPVVPASLLSRVVVSEGTNVYAVVDTLPTSGQDIDVVLDPPVRVTGQEPVSLGVRIDLQLNTAVPSFVLSVEDAGSFAAADAVSGADVPVAPAGGAFPVQTNQANLVSPAGNLTVSLADGPVRFASPGQADVAVAEFGLASAGAGPSSSAVTVGQLAFVLRDTLGATVVDPLARFSQIVLRSAYQEHFRGMPTTVGDTLVVVPLSTPAIIASETAMTMEMRADLADGAGLGAFAVTLAGTERTLAYDANTGAAVPALAGAGTAGPPVAVLAAPGAPLAAGAGRLPATIAAGMRDLGVLDLSLAHTGGAGAAPVAVDSLVFTLLDAGRLPLDPATLLDRVRVLADGAAVGDVIDPSGPAGRLAVPLSGALLAPGGSLDLAVVADVMPGLTSGSCEFVLGLADIHAHSTTDGNPVTVVAGSGVWPVSSGVARVVVPADELAVAVTDLMPALLAPGAAPYPVLDVTVRNTASPTAGDLALSSLTLGQPAAEAGGVALGAAVAAVSVLRNGVVVGAVTDLDPAARTATVNLPEPVVVPAATSCDLTVAVTVRTAAGGGTLTVQMDDAGFGVGPAGGAVGGVRVVPAPGTALPAVSTAGNLVAADLAASYVNFPNPFQAGHEQTTFAFLLASDARVTLKLCTPHGEAVATIIDGEQRAAGFYQTDTWDGSNGRGEVVRNGVYLAEIVVEYTDGTRARLLRKVAVVR